MICASVFAYAYAGFLMIRLIKYLHQKCSFNKIHEENNINKINCFNSCSFSVPCHVKFLISFTLVTLVSGLSDIDKFCHPKTYGITYVGGSLVIKETQLTKFNNFSGSYVKLAQCYIIKFGETSYGTPPFYRILSVIAHCRYIINTLLLQ